MSKILKMTDRIKINVGKVSFTIAPLNQFQKIEISEQQKIGVGGDVEFDLMRAQTLLVKYGLKDIEGAFDLDGEPYKLEFDGDVLSDDCISEVFTLEQRPDYVTAHWQCLNEFPDKLVSPYDGKKLKGVALELVRNKGKSG